MKVATLERFRARKDGRRRSRYISTLESAKFSGQWLGFSRLLSEDVLRHAETNEHTNNWEEPHGSTVSSTTALPTDALNLEFEVSERHMTQRDGSSPWTCSLYLRADHKSLPLIVRFTARCGHPE